MAAPATKLERDLLGGASETETDSEADRDSLAEARLEFERELRDQYARLTKQVEELGYVNDHETERADKQEAMVIKLYAMQRKRFLLTRVLRAWIALLPSKARPADRMSELTSELAAAEVISASSI